MEVYKRQLYTSKTKKHDQPLYDSVLSIARLSHHKTKGGEGPWSLNRHEIKGGEGHWSLKTALGDSNRGPLGSKTKTLDRSGPGCGGGGGGGADRPGNLETLLYLYRATIHFPEQDPSLHFV